MSYSIALLPGDGIGEEVMQSARRVLDILSLDAVYHEGDIGWKYWVTEGNAFPERTKELLQRTDCALFGAITSKPRDEAEKELGAHLRGRGFVYTSPIIAMRQMFNLSINLRPCRTFQGVVHAYENCDFVVFRENTEDLYAGVEFFPLPSEVRECLDTYHSNMGRFSTTSNDDMAISCRIITRKACQTIVRAAFEYAVEKGYKSVTVVEKPNVLRATSGLMISEAREVASSYSGVHLYEMNIDAMCMDLFRRPERYGVIVSTNLFGDILSDLCAQLVGGIGFVASANIGDSYAVFEPIHGSAPDIAGQGIANPIGMLLSVVMMLRWLGEDPKAVSLEQAIERTLAEGKVRTRDMGGQDSTQVMTDAICKKLV